MSTKDATKRWSIECNEDQLRLIANFVEDITRFECGQPQMMNCLHNFNNGNKAGEFMLQHITPMLSPELMPAASYGWNGGNSPNQHQRSDIAKGYCVYKSILSALAQEYNWDNVHSGTPLTCEEGGPLMKVRPIDEADAVVVTDYWLAANPNGEHCIFKSKPIRRKWANCMCWEPQSGGGYYTEELWKELSKIMKLPTLIWEDAPYKFTITTPKADE